MSAFQSTTAAQQEGERWREWCLRIGLTGGRRVIKVTLASMAVRKADHSRIEHDRAEK